jgi:anti-sigma factor RsiW
MSDQEPADHLEDSIAAYVLGSVGREEAEAVRIHLESSPAGRELERRLRRVVSELPLAARPVDPPAALRSRILASAGAAGAAAPTRAPQRRRWWPALPRPAPQWQQAWPRLATAAVALVVVGLGGWNVYLNRQIGQVQSNEVVARTQLVATAPSMRAATTQVLYLRGEHLLFADFNRLPALPAGHVYQLWLSDGQGKVVSADYFVPDSIGSHTSLIDRDPAAYSQLSLTVEPGPHGARRPSEPPRMVGRIQ